MNVSNSDAENIHMKYDWTADSDLTGSMGNVQDYLSLSSFKTCILNMQKTKLGEKN